MALAARAVRAVHRREGYERASERDGGSKRRGQKKGKQRENKTQATTRTTGGGAAAVWRNRETVGEKRKKRRPRSMRGRKTKSGRSRRAEDLGEKGQAAAGCAAAMGRLPLILAVEPAPASARDAGQNRQVPLNGAEQALTAACPRPKVTVCVLEHQPCTECTFCTFTGIMGSASPARPWPRPPLQDPEHPWMLLRCPESNPREFHHS